MVFAIIVAAAFAAPASRLGEKHTMRASDFLQGNDAADTIERIKAVMAELENDPELPASYTSCLSEVLIQIHTVGDMKEGVNGERACQGADQVCGSITDDVEQLRFYMKRALQPEVSHVCETGFFRGESTAVWLCSKETTKVDSFDLEFSPAEYQILKDKFGDRLTKHEGDSSKTLPEFFATPDAACCDIGVADGGHEDDVPLTDLLSYVNASKRSQCAAKPTLLFVDEVMFRMSNTAVSEDAAEEKQRPDWWYTFSTTEAIQTALDAGAVQALQCCEFSRGAFCTMYSTHPAAPIKSSFAC